MNRIPDPNDPQPGDEFTFGVNRRTILARHGDYCWVDVHPSGKVATVSVDLIAKHYEPVVTWPDLPTDRYAVQYASGGLSDWGNKVWAEHHAAKWGGRVVRVRYEPLDGAA